MNVFIMWLSVLIIKYTQYIYKSLLPFPSRHERCCCSSNVCNIHGRWSSWEKRPSMQEVWGRSSSSWSWKSCWIRNTGCFVTTRSPGSSGFQTRYLVCNSPFCAHAAEISLPVFKCTLNPLSKGDTEVVVLLTEHVNAISLADFWGHWPVQPHRDHLWPGHLQPHDCGAQLPRGPLQEAPEEEADTRWPERVNARCGKVRSRNSHLRFPFYMFMNVSLPWYFLNCIYNWVFKRCNYITAQSVNGKSSTHVECVRK